MKHFVSQFAGLAMFLVIGAAAFAESASPNQQTVTGTVTCASKIAGQYACKKGETLQSCTLECVERGSKYELVVSGNMAYLLEGNTANLDRFAGGKATVTGLVATSGNKMEVESIAKPSKMSPAQPAAVVSISAAK
jgi:hypothetical protein